jgi:hypothetical protein
MAGILVFIQCPKVWTEESTLSLASYVFALGKTPSIKLVTLFCDSPPSLVDKLPRSIALKIAPRPPRPTKIFESILSFCASPDVGVNVLPIDLVLVVPELNELIVPEAIQCAALANRGCNYAFLREKLDGSLTRVEFLDARHWMLGQAQPPGGTLMTKYSVLLQDQDELKEDDGFLFETLAVLKKRGHATPLPSLSCPLPLSAGSVPPVVPWKQVYELIKSAML